MKKLIDAVSIVITCGDEIFAIQRQRFLKAFPGYWAFPGGKVEKSDEEFHHAHSLLSGHDLRLIGALAREGEEEIGINLKEILDSGVIESIDLLGLAVTPDFNPHRFSTYFYRLHLREKIPFKVDENEAAIARWMTCAELLENYNRGEVLAVPPVIKVIEELGKNPKLKFIPDLNFEFDSEKEVPFIESIKGVRQFMPRSHTLPPANRTNAFLIGDDGEKKILLDPSPLDDAELTRLLNSITRFGVDAVMLTHHHGDHHERATLVAQHFKAPILISQDSLDRIKKKRPDYFDGVEVSILKQDDIVTKWLGQDVIVHEIPGHDEGQLALAPKNLAWFIAGDLFQGVGTVVIGGDEGNMKKYFTTLEKIIAMAPKVLYPSHGIGLGGTVILEKTLDHRKVRENQILTMHKDGLTVDQMLETIYADVSKELWPYARENIKKHMEKLKEEKRM